MSTSADYRRERAATQMVWAGDGGVNAGHPQRLWKVFELSPINQAILRRGPHDTEALTLAENIAEQVTRAVLRAYNPGWVE